MANIAKVAVYGCSSAPMANLPFGCLLSKVAAPSVQSIHSELPLIEKFARRERERKGNVSPFDVRRFRIRGCLLGPGCPLFLFVERLKLQGNALSLEEFKRKSFTFFSIWWFLMSNLLFSQTTK